MRYIAFAKMQVDGPGARRSALVLEVALRLVVATGQPGRQPFDGGLVLGVGVHELGQLLPEPDESNLFIASPVGQLFNAPVGEVHSGSRVNQKGPVNPMARRPMPRAPRDRRRAPWPTRTPGRSSPAARRRRGRARAAGAGAWPGTARRPC